MKTTFPMTKSPRAVAQEALRLAQETLPAYSAVRSRKDFTQHQLFAILALKTFFKTDYRGAVQLLADFAELRDDLGLTKVPISPANPLIIPSPARQRNARKYHARTPHSFRFSYGPFLPLSFGRGITRQETSRSA
jgi:hypothetical protein